MTGPSLWMPKKHNRHKRERIWNVENTSQSQNWRKVPQMLWAPYIRYFPFSLDISVLNTPCRRIIIHFKIPTYHVERLPKQASCFGWLPHHLPNEGNISKIKFILSFWKQLTEVVSQVAQTVKNLPAMQENGSIPGMEGSPGTGTGIWLQSYGRRSLAGYSLWGGPELDMAVAT